MGRGFRWRHGGGARAWQFLKRNDVYREARLSLADGAPGHGGAPFPIRRQSAADRKAARWGLLAWEDPFARAGPASPFWPVPPMIEGLGAGP